MTPTADLARTNARGSAFNKPAYRYIRAADRLPSVRDAVNARDPMVKVRLFNPTGAGDWYITGYDPGTGIATGAVRIHEFEVGDFPMDELIEVRGRFGLPIERDLWWEPVPLSRIIEGGQS